MKPRSWSALALALVVVAWSIGDKERGNRLYRAGDYAGAAAAYQVGAPRRLTTAKKANGIPVSKSRMPKLYLMQKGVAELGLEADDVGGQHLLLGQCVRVDDG